MSETSIQKLIVEIFNCGGLKFGEFELKAGAISPVYFDLRVIISHPKLMKLVADLVWEQVVLKNIEADVVCGVPYTALPIATLVATFNNVPMILKRKETKKYGTGKMIEGDYKMNSKCLIIEDVITTGSSIVETAEVLRKNGLIVTDVIIILDRNQGAVTNLAANGIQVHSLIDIKSMLPILLEENLISLEQKSQVENFIKANQLFDPKKEKVFKERWEGLKNTAARDLLKICYKKSTNLCLSADLEKWSDVLEIAEILGPKICLLKTHVDTLNFENYCQVLNFREKLTSLSEEHDFLIMEDRKLADIGSTAKKQMTAKPFEINKWSHFITVHGLSGPSIFQSVEDCGMNAVAIAELSSEGNLMTKVAQYKSFVLEMGKDFDCVTGFVSQSEVGGKEESRKYLQFTPGVSLEQGGDGMGQVYNTVEEAVLKRNADIIIVGRAIFSSKENWVTNAEQFRAKGWKSLCERLLSS